VKRDKTINWCCWQGRDVSTEWRSLSSIIFAAERDWRWRKRHSSKLRVRETFVHKYPPLSFSHC